MAGLLGDGKKFDQVMHEWGGANRKGTLRSGSPTGAKVPKTKAGQKQALAIAFSEQRKANQAKR
jgi:hypothetical protein